MNRNPHKNNSDRLLYFQIALSVILALTLLVINYEKPKMKFENTKIRISGLQVRVVDPKDNSQKTMLPPEIKKMKKN